MRHILSTEFCAYHTAQISNKTAHNFIFHRKKMRSGIRKEMTFKITYIYDLKTKSVIFYGDEKKQFSNKLILIY